MIPAGTGEPSDEAERKAPAEGKSERVRAMFSDIAPTYDALNRLMSFGVDQRWRAQAAAAALPDAGAAEATRVLDVACGTGDLTFALKRRQPTAQVFGADFTDAMLAIARDKAHKLGLDVTFLTADGTDLPFQDASFDAVTIGYGLRNFADPAAGLAEFRRLLKPGGRLVVLEFPPPPEGLFGGIFRFYFRKLLPRIGGLISGQRAAYDYLPESVLSFLSPQALDQSLRAAGFTAVTHKLQTFGVSALHVADVPTTRRKP